MPRYLFTIVAFVVFLLALAYESSDFFPMHVSSETTLTAHRETHHVAVGQSSDGALAIREIAEAPHVPIQARYANHLRTLRTFVAPNQSGTPMIYLESVHPHIFYVAEGAFTVLPDEASFMWTSPTTFMFYGTDQRGLLARFTIDVRELLLTSETISEIPEHDDRPVFDSNI